MAVRKKRKKLSQRQKDILYYIEECIAANRHPPSIREICQKCDISSTSVADYNLKRLEEMGHIDRQSNISRGIRVLNPIGALLEHTNKYNIPLYGTITAGEPIFTPDNTTPAEGYIEISRSLLRTPSHRSLYALRVKGHSMIDALIDDGDIVVLAHQEFANNGDMVAAQIVNDDDHHQWTLKRFYQRGEMVELRPSNPMMFTEDDIKKKFTFLAKNVKISGKVCLVVRKV